MSDKNEFEERTPVNMVSEARTLRRLMKFEQDFVNRFEYAQSEYRGGLRSVRRSLELRTWIIAIVLTLLALAGIAYVSIRSIDRITSREVHLLLERHEQRPHGAESTQRILERLMRLETLLLEQAAQQVEEAKQ